MRAVSKYGAIRFYFLPIFQLFLTIFDRFIPTSSTNGNVTNLFDIIVTNLSLILSLLELIVCFINIYKIL